MAKQAKYPYPSRYGSHRSMVVFQWYTSVFCKDEFGLYVTHVDNLDNGLADPKRYKASRLGKLGV